MPEGQNYEPGHKKRNRITAIVISLKLLTKN